MKTISISWRFDYIKFALLGVLLLGLYYPALFLMVKKWDNDQYSYCYLIPFVVLYLIWEKRSDLVTASSMPSWKGLVLFALGLALFWIGELGGEHLSLLLSFWLVLVGLCWMHFGWEKLKSIGFALVFILTMFPLPHFLNTQLMMQLRLISSKLGVFLIQVYGLPVNREGNIIDLGFTQLQVVEACSGLYSLISLVVLCLLLVYFFKDHLWKRTALLLSSIILAILSNSLRIAVTAILYKYFGSEIAEGFFHGFSGLAIFILCVPILLIEMKILQKLPPVATNKISNHTSFQKQSSKNHAGPVEKRILVGATNRQSKFLLVVMLLVATLVFSRTIEFREKIPAKKSLDQFPLEVANWSAESRQPLAKIFLDELDLSEYMLSDFQNNEGQRINFYVAYYESQSRGKSIHSPASCLPGSGWSFEQAKTMRISAIPGYPDTMKVNRAVMQLGRSAQIAYYWFSQRGRILSNAYQLKIYNFWDALTMQRTDGALVRLITPIYETESLADADARLQDFVRDIVPVLEQYIPGKDLAPQLNSLR